MNLLPTGQALHVNPQGQKILRRPLRHCPAKQLYRQLPRLHLNTTNPNRFTFEEAQDPKCLHHIRMPRIPQRELVHFSSFRITSRKRPEAISEKIFQLPNFREAYVTAPGQRFNLLPLTFLDDLYRSRVLVHNILKRKHNSIIQRRFWLLRKTTHKDLHRFHLIQLPRSITNTHVCETRRYTTLRHNPTTNLLRLTLKEEGVSRSIGNVHRISARLDCFGHQIKSKPAG